MLTNQAVCPSEGTPAVIRALRTQDASCSPCVKSPSHPCRIVLINETIFYSLLLGKINYATLQLFPFTPYSMAGFHAVISAETQAHVISKNRTAGHIHHMIVSLHMNSMGRWCSGADASTHQAHTKQQQQSSGANGS